MKKFILFCMISLLAACGTVETETPVPETSIQEQVEREPEVLTSSNNTGFMPEEGLITGDIGSFEGVDSAAYQIDLNSEVIDIYSFHEDGQVMVRLAFASNVANYLNSETHSLTINDPHTDRFLAIGCQGNDLYGWDYDSHAPRGNMVVTPIGVNTWLVEYDLEWVGHFLQGHVILTEY